MRFHLLGLAHIPLKWDECLCPFTTLAYNMAKMIRRAGHELVIYAPAGSEVECDEFVEVVAAETLAKTADNRGTFRFRWHNNQEDLAWKEHVARAKPELAKRYRHGDIALISFGYFQRYAVEVAAIAVEYICGYSGIFHKHRVFPSYAWFHQLNGWQHHETDPSWYDAVIPHYLDPAQFPFVEKKADYLAFLGRMDPNKGTDIAADIAQACKKELRIAGRYINDEKLPPWLHGKKRLTYLGAVRHAERVMLLSHARAALFPSRWIEPFGMTTIEAMACGTPVITSDFGAHTETVEHGVTGFRCRDFHEFCEAVERVGDIDPAACRKRVEERYSLDAVWPQYERYFRSLLRQELAGTWYARPAQAIPMEGVQTFADRNAMLSIVPKGGAGAEVGVLDGDFSAVLLETVQPTSLHLIDCWQTQDPATYADEANRPQAEQDAKHAAVLERFAPQIESGQVVVVRKFSSEALVEMADNCLDWIFVDANHGYEACRADLAEAYRLVKPGGLIMGHDLTPRWPGVNKAVYEFLQTNPVKMLAITSCVDGAYAIRSMKPE